MSIRLVCFGNSTENLQLSIKYKVIGVKRKQNFNQDELVYLVKKDADDWNVYARAFVDSNTDIYPFKDGSAYYTYSVKNLITCSPYRINELCKEHLGPYWGLKLQQPSIIEEQKFIADMDSKFGKNIDK